MLKALIFAGTTEGRNIADYLNSCGVDVAIFVATDYGESVLNFKDVHVGRLDIDEMKSVFKSYKEKYKIFVIDATHPYATVVSENVKTSCEKSNIHYFRLLRKSSEIGESIFCEDTLTAIEYLNSTVGNVLLTIGSKELSAYTQVNSYEDRLYARVLPMADVIEKCITLGFARKNIICMQGPFSKELNIAMIKQIDAKYLVTKDTGLEGGFDEKIAAAGVCGVKAIVINRPTVEVGYSFDELKLELIKKYNIRKHISSYFPLFMNIKRVLIIGGGKVAERRAKALYSFNAEITIIAPVSDIIECAKVKVIKRTFIEADVNNNYDIIISATDDRQVNKRVGELAKLIGVLVNVADSRDESTFYFPAIIQGSGVVGGIVSETGSDHSLVKNWAEKLRRYLNN